MDAQTRMTRCPCFLRSDPAGFRLARPGSISGYLRLAGAVGRCLIALLLVTASVRSASAQEQSDAALRVTTRIVPPLVVEQNGALTGFSIDLWTSIAERLKVRTS